MSPQCACRHSHGNANVWPDQIEDERDRQHVINIARDLDGMRKGCKKTSGCCGQPISQTPPARAGGVLLFAS